VADRVTVLRQGRTTLSAPRAEVDAPTLIRAMVGRDIQDAAAVGWGSERGARGGAVGEPVASLDEVRVRDASGRLRLDDVSLTVCRGEIVGVAGVEGNGQRELALLLAGRIAADEGIVRVPARSGFVPQDRTREGLIADFDLVENVALALHDDSRFRRGMLLRWAEIEQRAEEVRSRFGVRAPDVRTRAGALSGGNQQRLVVGRELAGSPELVVAENPTRGLDVAATAFVHEELVRLARAEARSAIVLVSTDLDEVLALSDRVLVMTRGSLVPVGEAHRTREGVGALMLGGRDAVA
jgi:simple sugar transport system ATP-binding protein